MTDALAAQPREAGEACAPIAMADEAAKAHAPTPMTDAPTTQPCDAAEISEATASLATTDVLAAWPVSRRGPRPDPDDRRTGRPRP